MPKPKISPGQAILLVLQENKITANEKLRLEALYMTGCENDDDISFLTTIISHAAKSNSYLQAVDISFEAEIIDADPSRRYFETHLAYHTTITEVEKLDLEQIQHHYTDILELIKNYDPVLGDSLKDVADGKLTSPWNNLGKIKEALGADVAEYLQAISEAKKKFTAEEHEKIKYVMGATLLGLICTRVYANKTKENPELFSGLPLNIYGKGLYAPSYRGRKSRDGLHFFSTTGILKSNTPAPYHNDPVRYADTDKQHSFTFKPTENSQYVLGLNEKNWSDNNFAKLLQPFVNSISGTILSQLRACRQLLSDNKFQFNEIGPFSNYMKCLISSMLYLSGGHTFYEFTYPFKVKEIQDAYCEILGFEEQMTVKNLFYQTNSEAFSNALKSAGEYNLQIVQRALVHEELMDTMNRRMSQ
ncbi:hypothetical protein Lsan_3001 [Legionella santicrucis]|uniref:Uncharacterized protein n=1 Tax=Legionella santicrucis TaxID=45074 RepID=A0A0W0YH81_9GAMM|nr:hypothetical protein [Legionella santicrucis]KTD56313.1 hypothetical protein Lsan_3001 [Legionella santicrucis]